MLTGAFAAELMEEDGATGKDRKVAKGASLQS
jgi:hypothetical protein